MYLISGTPATVSLLDQHSTLEYRLDCAGDIPVVALKFAELVEFGDITPGAALEACLVLAIHAGAAGSEHFAKIAVVADLAVYCIHVCAE